MRKKILIIFPYEWLAFSPTVINLYDVLTKVSDVTIVTLEPYYFSNQRMENRKVDYVHVPESLVHAADKLGMFASKVAHKLTRFSWILRIDFKRGLIAILFLWKSLKHRRDAIIGTDALGYWVAHLMSRESHWLSLEIREDDMFLGLVDKGKIRSVVIQSEERYRHLFPANNIEHFIVQNAPIYQLQINRTHERKGLIYCGTAVPGFGLFYYLGFISEFSDFALTLRGAIPSNIREQVQNEYSHLITQRRLVIDDSYLDQTMITKYLTQFRIGFCFYDISDAFFNSFNYLSVPSGKLFSYFAAGVPVIGSDIPGLLPVKDFNAGILTNDYSPESIHAAIEVIEGDFDRYSANCYRAAEYFSFDKSVAPFVDHLIGNHC